jgi:hypothetical protein
MSRRLIAIAVMLPAIAHADDGETAADAFAHVDDQSIGPSLGVAGGGRTTPGGLLVAGHFLQRLNDVDWFDGSVSFVFGGGDAECFRDRMNAVLCDHGLADGYAGKIDTTFRRFWPQLANDMFLPFTRAGLGAAIMRFADDEITGIGFSLHAGAGLRTAVGDGIALTAIADFELGLAQFSNDVGTEPQLGFNFSVGTEFKL